MITIKATVSGKNALPIRVFIDNLDNTNDFNFKSPGSFVQNFDLPAGRYAIFVSGMNGQGKSTDIEVTGTMQVGPLPNGLRTAASSLFSEMFYVEI